MDSHTTGPRFKTRWVRCTFYWASDWRPQIYNSIIKVSVHWCVEGRGSNSRSGLTQDIKMSSCTCIPVWRSTSMDRTTSDRPCVCLLWRDGVSCPVFAAWHSCVAAHWLAYQIPVKRSEETVTSLHLGQSSIPLLQAYDLRRLKANLRQTNSTRTGRQGWLSYPTSAWHDIPLWAWRFYKSQELRLQADTVTL